MRVFAPTYPATAASPPTAVNTRHVPTRPSSETNGRWSGLASDLDDPDIGHGVVVGVLRYDRDAVRDRSGRDPAIVHRRPAPCRAEPGSPAMPRLPIRLVHGERLEPLRELIRRQPPRSRLRILGLEHAEPQFPQSDRGNTPLITGEPARRNALPQGRQKRRCRPAPDWDVTTGDRPSYRSGSPAIPQPGQWCPDPGAQAHGRSRLRAATASAAAAG